MQQAFVDSPFGRDQGHILAKKTGLDSDRISCGTPPPKKSDTNLKMISASWESF